MFPMTVTVNNAAQLSAIMAALNIDQIMATPAPVVEAKPAPGETKPEPSPAAEQVAEKKSEPASTPEATATTTLTATADLKVDAAPEKKDASPDSPKSISYDEVAKAIVAVSTKYGRASAMSILGKYGLTTLKDSKPDQYAGILADALSAVGGS